MGAGERLPVFYLEEDGLLVYRARHGGLKAVLPATSAGVEGYSLTAAAAEPTGFAWTDVSGGGGGATNHNALSGLSWVMSGHTGTASRVAGFNGSGAATHYAIGSDLQAWDADLDALAGLGTTGLAARTGAGTWALRTLTGPAAGLTVTDGSGAGGNPTLALANDLAAVEGLSGTGLAARTAADTWALRTITAGGPTITITDGDGVAGNPTIALSGTVDVLTTTGTITSYSVPDCQWVEIVCVGAGGRGSDGVTGDNTANRAGGRGGGSAGWTSARWRREQLPDTLYYYVAPGGSVYNSGGKATAVFVADPGSFTDTALSATDASYILTYANGGSGGGTGSGGPAALVQLAFGLRSAASFLALAGNASSAAATSGKPADLTGFGGSTQNSLAVGASGAGKNTVPTTAAGGGWAAFGPFSAVAGGTSGGGAGTAGVYGGGNGTWTAASSAPEELAWGYGGSGGGSNTAGAGGAGGGGALGCGGGGGGAGTTAGGTGGDGGAGFVVIRCW